LRSANPFFNPYLFSEGILKPFTPAKMLEAIRQAA
jgi:hypothetical protein